MAGEPESLDVAEPLARRRRRHDFDRLIMLSDGVFAIAITLLAFDVRTPDAPRARFRRPLGRALTPQLDAFALGFVVISAFWLAQKRFMAATARVDPPLTVLNLAMLALVALVPAATRIAHGHAFGPKAMLLYAGLVVSIGLVLAVCWGYAALVANLVSPEVPRAVRWWLLMLIIVTPPLFLALIQLIPSPPVGAVPFALAALFMVGWPMRLWVARHLTPKGPPGEAGSEDIPTAPLARG